ncbi:MAG: tetratricopeptide repeat protein [Candidatus Omnitrophica bacterium]|nr:tetratricopeptide repeat protein [Candidatus Omnitrophota bacterium]
MKNKLSFIIIASFFISFGAYALDLDKIKVAFLSGDYKQAILEGEKIMARAGHRGDADELYYILGLCYLKDGNYLRASDIFEIIINEFKNSKFKEEAIMGLGDSYFIRGDYVKAEKFYSGLLAGDKKSKLLPQVYYRLSECAAKTGDTKKAEGFMLKLKKEFPSALETRIAKDLAAPELTYTVQVGLFSKESNAARLREKLVKTGYDAYIEEAGFGGKPAYRVRVGKLKTKQEADKLKIKLSLDGYPTKIFP